MRILGDINLSIPKVTVHTILNESDSVKNYFQIVFFQ